MLLLNVVFIIVGIALVVWGADRLTEGAASLARGMRVPEIVIGLTIVAAGTSAPEMFVSLMSAIKGTPDMAVGNVIGSNIFNTLAVVGIAGAISPSADFSRYVVTRDLPILLAMTILIYVFGRNRADRHANGVVSRGEGAVWTVAFAAYMALTIWQEVFQHG